MLAIVERLTPTIPQLIAHHQEKLTERLQEAFNGGAGRHAVDEPRGDRRAYPPEATVYGIRIDIAEELSRLQAHLNETRHIRARAGRSASGSIS